MISDDPLFADYVRQGACENQNCGTGETKETLREIKLVV